MFIYIFSSPLTKFNKERCKEWQSRFSDSNKKIVIMIGIDENKNFECIADNDMPPKEVKKFLQKVIDSMR